MSNRQRLQLEISETALARLDELVEECGAATRAELVRRALEVFDYLIEARGRGGHLVLELPDGRQRELAIALPASRKAPASPSIR